MSQPFASIEDAKSPSTITVQEIDGSSLSKYKEMADTGIFELPNTSSVSELTGSTPTLVPNRISNLRHKSARPGQLTENLVAKSFKNRRHAVRVSAGSSIKNWMKQTKTLPADNENKGDTAEKSPVPDLNRPLPPIPCSEDERFSWIKRNTVLDRLSDRQETTSSPVPTLDQASFQASRSESVRFMDHEKHGAC